MPKPKVSVVMPTYNEEKAVGKVIDQVAETLGKNFDYEIIIVDRSSDKTPEIVRSKSKRNPRIKLIDQCSNGYGRALYLGFCSARGDYIGMVDADLTYTVSDLPEMFRILIRDEADMVVGNRIYKQGSMPLLNGIGNWLITAWINLFFASKVRDSQCGMRVFKRKFFELFLPYEKHMPFTSEMIMEATHLGLRIKNFDTEYHPRVGEAKLNPLKDGFMISLAILQFMRDEHPLTFFSVPGAGIMLISALAFLAGFNYNLVFLAGLILFVGGMVLDSQRRLKGYIRLNRLKGIWR